MEAMKDKRLLLFNPRTVTRENLAAFLEAITGKAPDPEEIEVAMERLKAAGFEQK